MFKQLIASFFNSDKNTATLRTTEAEAKAQTPVEKMSAWLAHPMEYGKKPVYAKEVYQGVFQFPFMNQEQMPYSLVEYRMDAGDPTEVGFVSPISCWSFMRVFDFSKLVWEELPKDTFVFGSTFTPQQLASAYLGKMVLTFRSHLRMPNESTGDEKEKVTSIFTTKLGPDHSKIIDAIKVFGYTFYVSEVYEEAQSKYFYMPGVATDTEYEPFGIFASDNPMVQVGALFAIGVFFNQYDG